MTVVAGWFLADAKTGAREPIGPRVIEVPENLEQFENRDTRSRFLAYVPPGSVKRGEALAAGIPGKTDRCAICHGADLKGLAAVPPIAGRSPSYAVRQLYEFQTGARDGAAAALMKPVVANLTIADMVALAAYLSSRERVRATISGGCDTRFARGDREPVALPEVHTAICSSRCSFIENFGLQ